MATSIQNITSTSYSHRGQHISPEWMEHCDNDYYKSHPHRKITDELNALTNMANALAHMDASDRTNIDSRTFCVTIHLHPSIHHIHKKILAAQRAINRKLIQHFRYGSCNRSDKIGIISGVDYTGSRTGSIVSTSEPSPHLHLLLFFPKELFSFLAANDIPQEVASAIIDLPYVQPYELNADGDVISRGIYVEAYRPIKPLWYAIDYAAKYAKERHINLSKPSSVIISPRDELAQKFQNNLIKRKNFSREVDLVLSELTGSPENYYSFSGSRDWCEASDSDDVFSNSVPIIIPRHRATKIPSIDVVIDDYISCAMNCYVRGLELPLGTKRVETLLHWEFVRAGGRWNWLKEQERARFWMEHWRQVFRLK